MLKVAIVGCGKIADAHASQIQLIEGCEVVAACDREELMARQICERFGIPRQFGDLAEMLREARPDVVHITTPPQSHFHLAKQCLLSGAHIYVEKPFTLDAGEAEELLTLADKKGLKLTVGHDEQFRFPARQMRKLIAAGYLGGDPVHLDCMYTYDLSDPVYAKALLSDSSHWAHSLPGKLLHNLISHGIAKISEFFRGPPPEVIVHGFVSPFLRGLGGHDIVDELRVIISNERRQTAYFTFSSQLRPDHNQLRIFGPKNGLIVDYTRNTVVRLPGARYKSYLESVVPPAYYGRQYLQNSLGNLRRILRRDLQWENGKKFLFEALYRSIRDSTPAPIPYDELLVTARIMDAIFAKLADVQGPPIR